MAYEATNPMFVSAGKEGAFGDNAMGFILGLLFGRNGLGGLGNGVGVDTASMAANNAAFEGVRDQVNQLSQQLNANQSALQNATVIAELSRLKDLFVSLDKDNTIRDCQSTASILASICKCCCDTQAAICDVKTTVLMDGASTRLEMSTIAAAQALANSQTQNMINMTACETQNTVLREACAGRVQAAEIAASQALEAFKNTTLINQTTEASKDAILAAIAAQDSSRKDDIIAQLRADASNQLIINTLTQRCGCGCPTTPAATTARAQAMADYKTEFSKVLELLEDEIEAVEEYKEAIEACTDPELISIMKDILSAEKQHANLLFRWMSKKMSEVLA